MSSNTRIRIRIECNAMDMPVAEDAISQLRISRSVKSGLAPVCRVSCILHRIWTDRLTKQDRARALPPQNAERP